MTIDSTVTRVGPSGRFELFAGGGIAALWVFSVGVFMMVIPVIGWVVGPAFMITAAVIAVFHLIGFFKNTAAYTASCPYCGAATIAGEPGSTGECSACKHHFSHHDSHLWKTE